MTARQPRPPSPAELLGDLLYGLSRATKGGLLAWQVDDAHPTSYCTEYGSWRAAVRSVDGDDRAPYALVLTRGEEALEENSRSPIGRFFDSEFETLHGLAAAAAEHAESLLADVAAEVRALAGPPRPRRRGVRLAG